MSESGIGLLESQIRNSIRNATSPPFPLSSIGENALISFLALPGIESWKHNESLAWSELSRILEVGLTFSLLGNNTSIEDRKRKIVNAIKRTSNVPGVTRSKWSEVKIGALLSYLGGKVSFVKEGPS